MTLPNYDHLSFRLAEAFVARYVDKPVDWGFPIGGGNTLGELTFYSKYSRQKPDGSKERWFEACQRVIEGMFSIQKNHCLHHRIPWNERKAMASAQEAYDRMFHFKWLPPGRGLQHMGTKFVFEEGSAALQNCAFLSTKDLSVANPTKPFTYLMEMSMLGVGVGFDTLGAGKLTLHHPRPLISKGKFQILGVDKIIRLDDFGLLGQVASIEGLMWIVADSREGWCESVGKLLESYFLPNKHEVEFDYSQVRPAGSPLKRFGGFSAGPEPLKRLHIALKRLLENREGQLLTATDIVDIQNLIGKAVVAGSSRRSAELALGDATPEFLDLKNPFVNPERLGFVKDVATGGPKLVDDGQWESSAEGGWGYLSNNSVAVVSGQPLDDLVERIAINGEPGLVYLDVARKYGRLVDPPNNRDYRVMGVNPCAEQTLENFELCTLVEVFPTRCEDKHDFLRTLKFAYLYGKSVTLLPTHWGEVNEVMTRNRRIGTSLTGVAQFHDQYGTTALREWVDEGYAEIQRHDVIYSEYLGVRESIKTTSIKPSGTVSLLAGVWPGVHWPVAAGRYIRRVRERANDPMVDVLRAAGYHIEPDAQDPDFTVVVSYPTSGPVGRDQRQVAVWEKVALAALIQRHWADNAVSATFSFRPDEVDQLRSVLRMFEGQLKTVSFLPLGEQQSYPQMPYEAATDSQFAAMRAAAQPIDWEALYNRGADVQDEKFCTNDTCVI